MKTVSIIVPVFNTEPFLRKCLDSLLNQTYKDVEIIVVNDGSTDGSAQIIAQYEQSDERIKSITLPENKGQGYARNCGLDHAKGEYVYFIDSDDYLPEESLQYLVENIGSAAAIKGRISKSNFSTSRVVILNGQLNTKAHTADKYDLIKNNSVVNCLFNTNFIKKNKCRFSEDNEVFSDLQFLLKAFSKANTVFYLSQAVYFKRNRPDPIRNPSLTEQDIEITFPDFLKMYNKLKETYKNKSVNNFLDNQLLNFYRNDIVKYFNNKMTAQQFQLLSDSMKKVSDDLLKEKAVWFRHEVKVIQKGSYKRYVRANRRYKMLRDLRAAISSKEKLKLFIYDHFFTKLPVKKNLIFFESFSGKSYSDSPKYVYEYVHQQMPSYKTVWSLDQPTEKGPQKQVERLSLKYYYYLARANYWVINSRMPNYINKRAETTYLQTWHGTPLKRLAGDMENVLMPGTNPITYKLNFKNETAQWDYLVSPNSYSSEIFKRAFWFEKELLEFGYPRNDILYTKNNEAAIKSLKEKLNLPADKKVILYAPTWRDDEYYSIGNYKFSLKFDLEKMQDRLGDKYIIILRMHYLIASKLDISNYEGFVYDYSSYDDISELYLLADILITDYSSVFFDYANLKRPILFYTYDIEKYRDQLRGFYLDLESEVPGPLLKTTDEIIRSIENIAEVSQQYQATYEKFSDRFCKWDDGQASKNIAETVFKRK